MLQQQTDRMFKDVAYKNNPHPNYIAENTANFKFQGQKQKYMVEENCHEHKNATKYPSQKILHHFIECFNKHDRQQTQALVSLQKKQVLAPTTTDTSRYLYRQLIGHHQSETFTVRPNGR